MGPDVAERIEWVEADLAAWTPHRDEYDLVVCRASPRGQLGRGDGAADGDRGRRGGTLFPVGHRPVDPATGAATAAAGQVQVSAGAALCHALSASAGCERKHADRNGHARIERAVATLSAIDESADCGTMYLADGIPGVGPRGSHAASAEEAET